MTRRVALVRVAGLAAALASGAAAGCGRAEAEDPLVRRTTEELGVFTDWLAEFGADG